MSVEDSTVYETDNPIHVVPVNDLRDHVAKSDCWCKPNEIDNKVFVHNAMDRREQYEKDGCLH